LNTPLIERSNGGQAEAFFLGRWARGKEKRLPPCSAPVQITVKVLPFQTVAGPPKQCDPGLTQAAAAHQGGRWLLPFDLSTLYHRKTWCVNGFILPEWVPFFAEYPGFCKKWLAQRGRNGKILL